MTSRPDWLQWWAMQVMRPSAYPRSAVSAYTSPTIACSVRSIPDSPAIAVRTPSCPCRCRDGVSTRGGSGNRISAVSVNSCTTSSNRRSSTAAA
ncbi:hypothetical protein AU196_08470 [Mycobacterium sp. IS-1742]|nr:hypothetical protein AU196_08470 [Mycobacterium sp. IS-1742]